MGTQLSQVKWKRVLIAGSATSALSLCLLVLIIGGYAANLAIQARGQPDPTRIGQFASQASPWLSTSLSVLLTLGAAVWVGRSVETGGQLHGVLVGLVVALLGLVVHFSFNRSLDVTTGVAPILTVTAGWLGGLLGSRLRLSARST